MLEEASKYSDLEEEEVLEDEEQGVITDPRDRENAVISENLSGRRQNDFENLESYENSITYHELPIKPESLNHNINERTYEFCDENDTHYGEEKVVSETHSNSGGTGNLMGYIRFCPERRKIILPLEVRDKAFYYVKTMIRWRLSLNS